MPLAVSLLKPGGMVDVVVERGTMGAPPATRPAYVALCHYTFTSIDTFMAAFLPHAALLQADIANFTDIAPVIQFSEICPAVDAVVT